MKRQYHNVIQSNIVAERNLTETEIEELNRLIDNTRNKTLTISRKNRSWAFDASIFRPKVEIPIDERVAVWRAEFDTLNYELYPELLNLHNFLRSIANRLYAEAGKKRFE
ncbi:hypothetical protein [[Eubacterium] cellulosolvens]